MKSVTLPAVSLRLINPYAIFQILMFQPVMNDHLMVVGRSFTKGLIQLICPYLDYVCMDRQILFMQFKYKSIQFKQH